MALIEIRNLTKLYRMGESVVRALDGVDLSIHEGEFVAITGASGSGKSTMMHLLGCLDRPTEGEYILNNRSVSSLSDRELARVRNQYIGFVFQTFNLINRTSAVENVGVPLFYARRNLFSNAAKEALERVGLGHRYKHAPNELSGGERQRVAIARAIVNNPVLLLADEPTGNLDSRTGEAIMQVFHDLNAQGVTVVIVTHEPDVAVQARRIVQMKDGKILSDRPTAEIVAENPAFGAVATKQLVGGINDNVDGGAAPGGGEGDQGGGVAVLSRPATQAAPVAETLVQAEPAAESKTTAHPARGAVAALVLGMLCGVVFAGARFAGIIMKYYGVRFDPETRAFVGPEWGAMLAIGSAIAAIVWFILAIITMIYSRVVIRRAKKELRHVTGVWRARAGFWLAAGPMLYMVGAPLVRFAWRAFVGQ